MNLRKASKAQLIKEIKRLRGWEKQAIANFQELARRDEATKNYKMITPFAVVFAKILNDAQTLQEKQSAWEHIWYVLGDKIDKKIISQFWAERTADLIGEYADTIRDNESYLLNYTIPDRPERR